MKKLLAVMLPVLILIGCKKDPHNEPLPVAHPQMRYTDLNNSVVRFEQQKSINLDEDATYDVLFSTMLVGDALLKRDRRQYFVTTAFHVSLQVGGEEQMPVLNSNDSIKLSARPGFNWYNANSLVLAEKIIELNGPSHWEGDWKNASHKYVAIQIKKDNERYNGWIEVSFDTATEAMILHRAAISVEPDKAVVAGY